MKKSANNVHPIHPILHERWSPRAFSDKPVPSSTLHSLLEAARWSASCYNEQPWAFIVATREQSELYDKVLSSLVEFNRGWAKTAPVLMLAFAHDAFDRNQKPNAHAQYDLGACMAQLTAEATSHGLYVHQMAGIESDHIRSAFAIPDDWRPMTGVAIGYLGDPAQLSDDLQKREMEERTRKPLGSFVFGTQWGEASSI